MTPQELNRKMEFIVEVQARTSVTVDLLVAQQADFEKWSRNVLVQLAVDHQRMVELVQIQSERLDRSEQRLDRAEREDLAAQRRFDHLLAEMRAGFDRVLDKLSEKPN